MNWENMDSAPTNGKKIIIAYQNSCGNWRRVMARWVTKNYINEYWEEADECDEGWYECSESHESVTETVYPVEGKPQLWHEIPPLPTMPQ